MKLHTLKPASGATKTSKRIGRGQGSGKGGTSTKGTKGAQARTGYNYRSWFEGGQMPLQRRIPKFGFKNPGHVDFRVVNLDTIQEFADLYPGEEINHGFLAQHGIISNTKKLVKVLGRGELTAKVVVRLNKFSETAKAAIEKAGGSVIEA
jgi:large subunit ribosomal protein L15